MDAVTISKCSGASLANARIYMDPINAAMAQFQIDKPRRQAAFLATVGVETQNLTKMEEGFYYLDAARLASIYPRAFKSAEEARPYTRNSAGLSKLLYGGFHGRGGIQLTWEKNYRAAGDALGKPYLVRPELVAQPVDAMLTAAWFWTTNGCNIAADAGDMRGVTRIVNGPKLMHLAEREDLYDIGIRQWA